MRTVVVIASLIACGALCSQASASGPLGTLTQLSGTTGCVSRDGTSGACALGRGLAEPESLTFTHDGKFAYGSSYAVGAQEEQALTAFKIGPGGQLEQLAGKAGCFTEDGSQAGTTGVCTAGRTIGSGDGTSIAISPDDRFLYAVSTAAGENGVAVFARNTTTGALTQLSGAAGCVDPVGAVVTGCGSGRILTGAGSLMISPDPQGKFLYVATLSDGHPGMAIFRRDPSSGVLTQLSGRNGCLSVGGLSESTGQLCQTIIGADASSRLEDPVITPDGRSLYVSAFNDNAVENSAVLVFSRDPSTGLLMQQAGVKGCITSTGQGPGGATCAEARALAGAYVEAISPDGENLYVSAYNANAIVVFRRQSDGSLAQLPGTQGCVSADGSSQDGAGTCEVGRVVSNAQTPAVSPDGRSFYTSSYTQLAGGIGVFNRDPSTGVLTQVSGKAGCITGDGSSEQGADTCTAGRALSYSYDVASSPDGGNVYVAGDYLAAGGFAVFSRRATPVCVSATLAVQQATPTPVSLSCSDPNGDPYTRQLVTGPAHGTVGALSAGATVLYTPAKSFFGTDRISFRATDATGPGVPASIELNVIRDTTPPKCNQFRVPPGAVASFLKHGLEAQMSCSEATTLKLTMTVGKRTAHDLGLTGKAPVKIASGKGSSTGPGKVFVKLKFTGEAKRILSSVKPARLGVAFGAVAVDRAGNRATKQVQLTLK